MPSDRRIEYMPLVEIKTATRNPKLHALNAIGASFNEHGFVEPLIIDERTERLVAGHGRREQLLAVMETGRSPPEGIKVDDQGRWLVPVGRGWASRNDKEADEYLLASNQLTILGGWDLAELVPMLKERIEQHANLEAIGWSADEIAGMVAKLEAAPRPPAPTMRDRFLVPPFSVLDARQGYWQDRKRAWLAIGIQSEIGRGANLLKMSETALEPDAVKRAAHKMARTFNDPGRAKEYPTESLEGGTSIFDPCLCELAYRWFCPAKGEVLDPFAGGSVRGIVAAKLGLDYVGVDLRQEQVDANWEQARQLCGGVGSKEGTPCWTQGDSQSLDKLVPGGTGRFDLLFGCPPYADLERYSDDPRDLSTMKFDEFLKAYRKIIAAALRMLKTDRFAAFVVGDVRDPKGLYRDLPGQTIRAFEDAGAKLYNDAVLVTSVGSLPIRAGKIFSASRKLGTTHQRVLVFVKGDPIKAAKACGIVEVAFPEDIAREEEPGEAPAAAVRDLPLIYDPAAITPIQSIEGGIWLKRDDRYTCAGARGGKARALITMLRGAKGVTCAGNRLSPMVSRVARVAKFVGVPARCHCAGSKELTPQEQDAVAHGAELIKHKVNYLNALVSKARRDAEERGWVFAPLGVEGPEYFAETKRQVTAIPEGVQRIVVCVGSGMTAAAILAGLVEVNRRDIRLLGVQVGMDPVKLLDKWAPVSWRDRMELVTAAEGFAISAEQTAWWGIELDPHYEAKCAPFVKTGDLFWITAIRSTGDEELPPSASGSAASNEAGKAEAPAWAKGYPLEILRERAAIFKAHDKPYVLGAFGGVKENQIAEWMAKGELRELRAGQHNRLAALAVVRKAKATSSIEDFSGAEIGRVRPGDLVIKRIAGDVQLLLVGAEYSSPRAWLEIWQEHEASRKSAEQAGFKWAGTKVSAASELIGVWARGVEVHAPESIEQAALVPLKLPVEPISRGIHSLKEAITKLAPSWADHYSTYNKRHSWSALSLRGYGEPDFIEKPAEMSKEWKEDHPAEMTWQLHDTPLRSELPEAEPLIEMIPGVKHRIRLMKLSKGEGELTRHADITDPDAGVADGKLMRIHIPIETNEQVRFEQWLLDGKLITAWMQPGMAWYLDTRKPHTAVNRGDTNRIHLVLDVESSHELRALVLNA